MTFFRNKNFMYKLYNITYLKAALTSSSRLTCFCRELTATLRKSSQVKVPSQSQPASQTRFITSSSAGFLPEEQRAYPASLHWIASKHWNKFLILSVEPVNNLENWVSAIFSGTGSNPMQRGRIRSSLLGSESNRRWGDEPSLQSWLWLKKSSQVKVLFQSKAAHKLGLSPHLQFDSYLRS